MKQFLWVKLLKPAFGKHFIFSGKSHTTVTDSGSNNNANKTDNNNNNSWAWQQQMLHTTLGHIYTMLYQQVQNISKM